MSKIFHLHSPAEGLEFLLNFSFLRLPCTFPNHQFMKTKSILLISLASLALPSVASATLLVGWHSFSNTGTSFTPNQNAAGFQTSTLSNTALNPAPPAANGSSGSTDGWYGPDSSIGGGFQAPPLTGDGGRFTQADGTVMTVINGGSTAYPLDKLLFDAGITGSPGTFDLSFSYNGGPSTQLLNNATVPVTSSPAPNRDYEDFSVVIPGSIILSPGQNIVFRWTDATNNLRLDNLALLAIPEPTAAIALAGLLGSGAFFRRRKVTA